MPIEREVFRAMYIKKERKKDYSIWTLSNAGIGQGLNNYGANFFITTKNPVFTLS